MNDEELAANTPESEGEPKPPRMSQWDHETELLSAIVDRLGTLIRLGAKDPPRIDPAPRPVTAFQRSLVQRKRDRHASLVARLVTE